MPIVLKPILIEPRQCELETELMLGCLGLEEYCFKSEASLVKGHKQQEISVMQGD